MHTVEAYVIDAIKEDPLPGELPGCPLSASARRLLLAEVPVVVTTPGVDIDTLPYTEPRPVKGYGIADNNLRQPSNGHVRSFELIGDGIRKEWYDQYGNVYSSFNFKGNNLSNPGVMRHPTAVNDYIAYGLQESKIISRVIRAGEEMRRASSLLQKTKPSYDGSDTLF